MILDAYSRRVIGWHLSDGLDDSLTLAALRMALAQRVVRPGLVHHSDRGVQYASRDYTDLLKAKGIDSVVFDRNGYIYHGRIMALADAAREAGLKF